MKKLKLIVFLSAISVLSLPAFAVDIAGQVIGYNVLSYGNNFLVTLSTPKESMITCDTNSSIGHAVYTIPLDTSWGKAAAASIITAKVTRNTIKIYGNGTCNYWNNTEDAAMVETQ